MAIRTRRPPYVPGELGLDIVSRSCSQRGWVAGVGDGAYLVRLSMSATTDLSHVFPSGSAVNGAGHLELGGCDAPALAREFGTPVYIVVPDDLRRRARAVSDALSARHNDVDVLFASKAFPCTAVYRLLAAEGLACDVASGGELALALAGGFDPARIYLHGNAKSIAELEQAMDAGVGQIVLDSDSEIDRLAAIAGARATVQEVLLRVTPDVAGDTHAAISTGQADSKFGFSMNAARSAIDRLATIDSLALVGLHAHIGSQLFALEPFRDAVRAIATLGRFPVYNLGGGLAAAYLDSEHPPSAQEWVEAIVDAVHTELGVDVRLLLEPGRSLVAGSGVTLYTVQSVKRNVSTWVAVDGGMSDNLRPMLYGARYEAVIADRPLSPPDTRCHLAGKHCESGDVIVRDAWLPAPGVGDVVAVPATGAYGYAMASNYNGVCRPPVVFCEDGNARLVVRRETYGDLMSRDV
jgi:diaminopimelate decarboxylase